MSIVQNEFYEEYVSKIQKFDEIVNEMNCSEDLKNYKKYLEEKIAVFNRNKIMSDPNKISEGMNHQDVIELISKILPIIRVVKKPDFDISKYEVSIYVYNPYDNKWENNLNHIHKVFDYINRLNIRKRPFTHQQIENVIQLLPSSDLIPLIDVSEELDRDIRLQNGRFNTYIDFSNGRYNFKDGSFKESKPSDLSLFKLPYPLATDVDKKYQREFETYFKDVSLGDQERIKLLKQIALATIMRYNPDQKAINLYGPAGSGKSTFIKILNQISGNNSVTMNYDMLSKDDALKQIQNNFLILGYDNNERVVISKSLGIFKNLVSKDYFSYSVKYKDMETNKFTGLFVQAFNYAPEFICNGDKNQVLDRMLIIHFKARFRGESHERKNYESLFKNKKVISCFARWLIDTVEPFDSFNQADSDLKDQLLNQNDNYYQFVDTIINCPAVLGNVAIPSSHINSAYRQYMKEHDPAAKLASSKTLNSKIKDHMSNLGYELLSRKEMDSLTPRSAEDKGQYYSYSLFHQFSEDLDLPNHYSSYFVRQSHDFQSPEEISFSHQLIEYAMKKSLHSTGERNLTLHQLIDDSYEGASLEELKELI